MYKLHIEDFGDERRRENNDVADDDEIMFVYFSYFRVPTPPSCRQPCQFITGLHKHKILK